MLVLTPRSNPSREWQNPGIVSLPAFTLISTHAEGSWFAATSAQFVIFKAVRVQSSFSVLEPHLSIINNYYYPEGLQSVLPPRCRNTLTTIM